MPYARSAERAFSPLDEELQLLPGSLTPSLVESIVRLGTWMPFLPAAKMIGHFTKVRVSEPTVRRNTEKAGVAYVENQTGEVASLERELPDAPKGPERQLLSVDGAMVPLVGGEWAEVKTLAVGTVAGVVSWGGGREVHSTELSYFSRLTDHETFARLATVETHRRGTETADCVCAVVDGAKWEQKFIDLHRPDAVRILDWGHASEYVAKAGQAVFGIGTEKLSEWLGPQLHELRHGESDKVLEGLRRVRDELAREGQEEEGKGKLKVVTDSLEYLESRLEQIRYREFEAQGYPIGSGAVESANKLVVEARLKGAGMHWARQDVNPMVALRNIVCSDRWEEAWPQISQKLREQRRQKSAERRATREAAVTTTLTALTAIEATVTPVESVVEQPAVAIVSVARAVDGEQSGSQHVSGRKPAPNHPWRHMPIGKARLAHARSSACTES